MIKNYLIICIVFLLNFNGFSQTLSNSKKQLTSGSGSKSSSKSSSNSRNSNIDPSLIVSFFQFFGLATYGVLIGDYETENELSYNLNSHPFSVKGRGNYSDIDTLSTTNFRIDIANKFLTAGKPVSGNHLDVKIRPSKYFYFTTDWYQLSEYNIFTKKRDQLSLYYFNFAYDRVRWESFNLGWTMGASYVGDAVRRGGFSYGVNAELFLNSKISILADAKWSRINDASVNSYQITGKYFKKIYFATIGYERLKIATPIYNFIGIGAGIYF